MEVHHHPDLHHRKKDIREYSLEFIMIFLAVTLGFFAESLRESISNREKAGQYMHAMRADGYKIFDRIFILTYGRNLTDRSDMLDVSVRKDAKLMVTGTPHLIEYANKVKTLSNSLKMWYLPALLKQDDQVVSLIHLLEKQYPD
jgi:hypothetical protein